MVWVECFVRWRVVGAKANTGGPAVLVFFVRALNIAYPCILHVRIQITEADICTNREQIAWSMSR